MKSFLYSLLGLCLCGALAFAQNSPKKFVSIIDSVSKVKEDDDGKLIILSSQKKVLYLKNDQKNFEDILNEISNSQKFNSTLKFKTDVNLNIIEAK